MSGYITRLDLADMWAGDYDDVRMRDALTVMQWDWDHSGERPGDPEFAHENALRHGGPRAYIDYLKADIAVHGMTSPIYVRRGRVIDGHHRAVAALELGLEQIPVRCER